MNGNGVPSPRQDSNEQNGGAAVGEGWVGAEVGMGDAESLLYRPPHSDGATPPWPSDEAVARLREVREGREEGVWEGVLARVPLCCERSSWLQELMLVTVSRLAVVGIGAYCVALAATFFGGGRAENEPRSRRDWYIM